MMAVRPDADAAFDPRDLAALVRLYAQIPSMECAGRCWDSCTSIDMSGLERARLAARGFRIPPPRSVAQIREQGQRTGRVNACPALSALGACRVYEARPAVCRAFGAAEGLECAYGCRPTSRAMSFFEFAALLREIELVSVRAATRAAGIGGGGRS